MIYKVFGPFEIPRNSNGNQVDQSSLGVKYWTIIDKEFGKLSSACGCYIFSIKAAQGALPWYVGMTQKSFRQECFQPPKLLYYNYAVLEKRGTPHLHLLARCSAVGNKFTKPAPQGHKDIDYLEKYLIGKSLMRNPDLLNVKDTKIRANIVVPGVINSPPGNPGAAAKSLQIVLGK